MSKVTPVANNPERRIDLLCIECESPLNADATNNATTKLGARLCTECMDQYYVICSICALLIPQDECLTRDALTLCVDCSIKPITSSLNTGLADPESLINEYIALHAEEKRIKTRMDELKESLKEVAAAQQRISNSVTLRAGEQAVKCSFRSSLKCNQEVVESLAERLDEQEFEELFERKVSYNPHKERVQEFLTRADDKQGDVRELLRSAIIETETATLTVVANRKE